MNDIIENLKNRYQQGDITIKLIFICCALFLITKLLDIFLSRNGLLLENFFAAKTGLDGFISQPWGMITYAFFHGGLLHLVLNMVFIYYIGRLFLGYFRKEDFLTFFLSGAIVGAFFFMVLAKYLNYGNNLLGASAGIYAVFFALVSYTPKNRIRLMFLNTGITFETIAWIFLAFDLFSILSNQNVGGHISHLGGAAFGYFYMKQFEKGNDFIGSLFRKSKAPKREKPKSTYRRPPRDDYEFNAMKVEKQQKMDRILDKISRSGYESLSNAEKEFLFKEGKNN
ncbi:MAG: rhomboid family intramembrane serine protease [Weeksellaceae bacterium]